MRGKSLVFSVFLVFVLSGVMGQANLASAASVDVYLWGNESANWTDYDKVYDTWDPPMCWTAAAANVLSWTGWDNGLSNENLVFDNFRPYWSSGGGLPKFGYEWWFTGGITDTNYPIDATSAEFAGGGAYYPTQYTDNFVMWGVHDSYGPYSLGDAADQVQTFIDAGIGTAIDLRAWGGTNNPADDLGHNVTLWGYQYDDMTEDILGIYFTDSNDHGDDLLYYPIVLDYYQQSIDRWYLDGYTTRSNQYSYYYIYGLEGLLPMGEEPGPGPGPEVPEPATMFLLGTGLIGLAGFRKKFKK